MIGPDTNVLARAVTEDDAAQSRIAQRVLRSAIRTGTRMFVADVVWCELVWLLDLKRKVPRPRVAEVVRGLLDTEGIIAHDAAAVARALGRYENGPGDFADYLIAEQAAAAGATEVVTLDRALRREAGFRLVGS